MAHSIVRAFAQRMQQSAFRLAGQQVEAGQEMFREVRRAMGENVPEGHKNSNLESYACNISLQRMRDLTLRQDLRLHDAAGPSTIKDVFKGRVLLVGLPGGKVCVEKHLPGYLSKLGDLRSKELDKVVCVVPSACELLKKEQESHKGDDKVAFFEDRGYGFARMLGMDRGAEDGPPTQRYAGIVENGILLKLKVEQHPKDVDVSSVDNILKVWDELNNKQK